MVLPDESEQIKMENTAFVCQPPSQFNFSSVNDWPRWINRFERFRSISGLKTKPESEQIDCLVYTMGDEAEAILLALKLSEAESKSYEKVVSAFELHFIGKRNIIYERAKFNLRFQKDGESVDEFITSLHNLAKYCEFANLSDELIRDRIVAGVQDKMLSEKMQLDSNLTLAKATLMARQSERVKLQQSTVHSDPKEVKVDRIKSSKPKSEVSRYKGSSNQTKPPNTDKRMCYRCGGFLHPKKNCPAMNAICNKCGKRNHYSKVCRSKAGIKSVVANDVSFLGRINAALDNQKKWVASVKLRDKYIEFKIDTGADVNVVPYYLIDSHFPDIKLVPADRILMGPDGKALHTAGMFYEKLSYHGNNIKSSIYVVKNAEKALLSGNTSEALGILKRLCEISNDSYNLSSGKFNPLKEFPQLFVGLGQSSMTYRIVLKPNFKPYALTAPRRVPIPLREKVKVKLDEMEKAGVIEPVEEPTDWCSPMVIVPKPDGDIRICVDLSRLNKYIMRELHPMPVSEHILSQLGASKYFSKLDAYWGFWQIGLEKESQMLTTFISPFGRYKFKRLPFGISSAPEFFQKKMSQILSGLEGVVCNIDDVLIYGTTEEEHDLRLRATLKRLDQAGITLNKDKCHFRTKTVKYLGHIIDEEGIHPDNKKVQAIVNMSPPKNVSELKSFLGLVNYHNKFLPDLATIAYPLNDLLKSSSQWIWSGPQQNAFEELKGKLSSAPVLAKYDPALETIVSADASSFGIGSVLKQRQTDGYIRPIAYASRTLNPCERRYAQIEKEGLALVWACERFKDYITGIHIQLETDHRPLVAVFGSKLLDELTPRLQRMKLRLMRYSYDIQYIPGKQLIVADTLSRKPLQETDDEEFSDEVTAYVRQIIIDTPMSDKLLEEIKKEQGADSVLAKIRSYSESGWPEKRKVPISVRPFWQYRADISEVDGLLLKGNRLIIPSSLRKNIMNRIHEGHLGVNKCRMRAKASVWWPGLSTEIRDEVSSCEKCAKEAINHREPMIPSNFPDRPWQKVAMDLFYLEKKWYLLVTDYYSRYPEIVSLNGLSASNVISHIKSIFARHGIPEVVCSDNGPQFLPQFNSEFSQFALEWGFTHLTSSPKYAQSNGFVEAAVKIIKRCFKKENDNYLALLSYRCTPLENGFTPAELLFGRKLRSRLPVISHSLEPYSIDNKKLREFENKRKEKQKENYDKKHRVKVLSELPIQKRVWITDMKEEGTVVQKTHYPRSYIIQTEKGKIRRNRVHLIPLRDGERKEKSTPKNWIIKRCAVQQEPGREYVPSPPVQTRSGRIIKRPMRLGL